MREESKSERWERLAMWWFAVSGAGVGIGLGAGLSLGLLRIWRPSAIWDLCGLIGMVVFLAGIVGNVFCFKNAEWERNDKE